MCDSQEKSDEPDADAEPDSRYLPFTHPSGRHLAESRSWVPPSFQLHTQENAAGPTLGPAASFVGRERGSRPEYKVIVHPPSNGPPGQAKFVEGPPIFVWGLDAMTE